MRFEPNHTVMEKLQEYLADHFDAEKYAGNGPWALTAVIWDLCQVTAADNIKSNDCYNVTGYRSKAFYPVAWQNSNMLFEVETKNEVLAALNHSFAIHLWNKMSSETALDLKLDTALRDIARENCPHSWKHLK